MWFNIPVRGKISLPWLTTGKMSPSFINVGSVLTELRPDPVILIKIYSQEFHLKKNWMA